MLRLLPLQAPRVAYSTSLVHRHHVTHHARLAVAPAVPTCPIHSYVGTRVCNTTRRTFTTSMHRAATTEKKETRSTVSANTTAPSSSASAPSPPRTLLLVDASGIIFRQYFGMKKRSSPVMATVASPPAATESSDPSSESSQPHFQQRDVTALYGYVNSLLHLLHHLSPTHVVACHDLGRTSFRHDIYPSYKADRKPVEDVLKWQLTQLNRVTQAMGIKSMAVKGFEADDVIGTLARMATSDTASSSSSSSHPPFDRVVILSNDKDFVQCLSPRVSMLSPKSGASASYVYTHFTDVTQAFGVSPDRFVDYLVLLGDVVDGIPGVPGIGDAKAKKLMSTYTNLEGIMHAITTKQTLPIAASSKVATTLLEAQPQFELWRRLATIRTDVPNLLAPAEELNLTSSQNSLPDVDAAPPSSQCAWSELKYLGPTSNTNSSAVSSSSSLTSDRIIELYREFNFPAPPSFIMNDTTSAASSTSLTSISTSAATLRLFTHAEWSDQQKQRNQKDLADDADDASVVASAGKNKRNKTTPKQVKREKIRTKSTVYASAVAE